MNRAPPQPADALPASFHDYRNDLANVRDLLHAGLISAALASELLARKWQPAEPIRLAVLDPDDARGFSIPR